MGSWSLLKCTTSIICWCVQAVASFLSANRRLPKWPWQLFPALPVESQWFPQYICTPNSLHFLKLPNKFKWGTQQMYPSKGPQILAPNHCRLIALIAAERRLCLCELGQTLWRYDLGCQELVKMWKTFSVLMLLFYPCISYTQETNVTGVRFRPVGRQWNVICVWGSLCVCCTQGTGSCDLDAGVRKWN